MKYKELIGLFALVAAFLFSSCSNEESAIPESLEKDAILNFSIQTALANDPLIKGGDGSFSSLALYVFNKSSGYCEYATLIPDFTPQTVQEFTKSVGISSQTKVIYAIANYKDGNNSFSIPITSTLTMAQLEGLSVVNTNLSDANVAMIGKKEIVVNSQYVTAEIPMERLVTRLDIYLFKSAEAAADDIKVVSVDFFNQVNNTSCRYQNTVMITPVIKKTVAGVLSANTTLTTMPSDLSGLIPANAHTSFYSYQNIAASATTADDNITPYLRVKLSIGGVTHTYKGYLTDAAQGANKYSLMRSKVYRVIAMVDKLNNDLVLKTTIIPWTVAASEIGQDVEYTDYSLDPFNNNAAASAGIVQYPYVNNGVANDQTSYASYSFKLTAPKGAIWTATLTNGLDFGFSNVATTAGKVAVSKGITRTDPYEIKVGANKPWGGTNRFTYLYISVNGIKLRINPLVGLTRKFPGLNDTDILITQTKYQ